MKSKKNKNREQFFPKKIIVGNKKDLKTAKGESITKHDVSKLQVKFPGIKLKEVSALTNQNVADVFHQIVKDLISDPIVEPRSHQYV